MNSNFISEPFYIKKQYMIEHYGSFKSAVLRFIQFTHFIKITSQIINSHYLLTGDRMNKIESAKKMYDYLYSTRDIWTCNTRFKKKVREKLFDFTKDEPNIFKKYMILFGYICPYIEKNNICGKKVYGRICHKHKKEEKLRKKDINNTLNTLPDEICNIIFEYSIDYSWNLL